jgi:hypothetical protein
MKLTPRIEGIGKGRAASLKARLERRIGEKRMEREARRFFLHRLVRLGIRRDRTKVS